MQTGEVSARPAFHVWFDMRIFSGRTIAPETIRALRRLGILLNLEKKSNKGANLSTCMSTEFL